MGHMQHTHMLCQPVRGSAKMGLGLSVRIEGLPPARVCVVRPGWSLVSVILCVVDTAVRNNNGRNHLDFRFVLLINDQYHSQNRAEGTSLLPLQRKTDAADRGWVSEQTHLYAWGTHMPMYPPMHTHNEQTPTRSFNAVWSDAPSTNAHRSTGWV